MQDERAIGAALSGGGHRATAFGLGALLYLADSGASRDVTTISSVSGGSLLNTFVALQDRTFRECPPAEFDKRAAHLARVISGNRARWILTVRITLALLLALGVSWATLADTGTILTASAVALLATGLLLGPASGGFLFGYWGTWLYLGGLIWGLLIVIAWVVERHAILGWLAYSMSDGDWSFCFTH